MKPLLLLALLASPAAAETVQGFLVDAYNMGCNVPSPELPGFCAGVVTVDESSFTQGRVRRQFVVPWKTAIEVDGKKPHVLTPLPQRSFVTVTWHKSEDGVDTADEVVVKTKPTPAGKSPFIPAARPLPWQLDSSDLGKWLSTGYQKDYAVGVRTALDRGETKMVRALLSSRDTHTRRLAAWSLADAAPADFGAEMEALLDDPDSWIRAEALYYAKKLRRPGLETKAVALLKDADEAVRRFGAEYLAAVGARAHASALEPLLQDPVPAVKEAAQKALDSLR